jgi:hypothetical protein
MANWKTSVFSSIKDVREAIERTDVRREIKIVSLGSPLAPRILLAKGRRWTKEEMAILEGGK